MVKKALIIEDDPYMIANLDELLSLEGFEVQSVSNGAEAVACIPRFQPDIILSDMHMPGMSGIQVLESVRSNRHTAAIPFVFLTGRSESDHLHDALSRGANGYLVKPFQVNELLEVIDNLLPQ